MYSDTHNVQEQYHITLNKIHDRASSRASS